jgi:AcrR family transcriptional regulator
MAHNELPSAEETRSRILDVALELFAAQGFAATSTREISERLGFSKAALYYHFHTKDDLLEALLAPVLGRLTWLVHSAPARRGPAARRALLAGYVDLVADNAALVQIFSQDPSSAKRIAVRGMSGLLAQLAALLADSPSPDTATRARVRATFGCIHAVYRFRDPADDPEILRSTALDAACGALGLPPHRH